MSWGGSPSCGFDLSSEMEHTKQCNECTYFQMGWKGVTNPSPDICVHSKNKRKHNKRVQSKYYDSLKCKEFKEIS